MATRNVSGSSSGGTVTYNVGNQKFKQSQLNNNMSGTDANAIYYASHGGTGNAPVNSGNTTVTSGKKSSGNTMSSRISGTTQTTLPASSLSGYGGYESSGGGYVEGGGGGGANYQAMIDQLLAERLAETEKAYGAAMDRLENSTKAQFENMNTAWDKNNTALQNNLDSTLNRLKSNLDYSQGQVNDDAAKSLREAYVNYMLNKKNLAQGLSAMGISGGATESSMANMFNNYGNSRNNINTTAAQNIAKLLNEYQGNVSNANQLYNTQWGQSALQRMEQENALRSQVVNAINTLDLQRLAAEDNLKTGANLNQYANYASTLANLASMPSASYSTPSVGTSYSYNNGSYASDLANIGKNAGANLTPIQNTLGVNSVTTNSANNMGTVTDYAKYKAMADAIASEGGNTANIIYQLKNSGADNNMIYKVLGV